MLFGGISFTVNQGEFISIIGPSGCGKSTLLSIISGLEKETSGEIYINRFFVFWYFF